MERRGRDFLPYLGPDVALIVVLCLDESSDLARFCAVSTSWRKFAIENGLSKRLWLKLSPELSSIFTHVIETENMINPLEVNPESNSKWEILKRDYKVYDYLTRGLSPTPTECISDAICASSCDNIFGEEIENTLEPGDTVEGRASYWSSEGSINPLVKETLIYKLMSKLCVITEVNVQPFQAQFQVGSPIYSAKYVQFRMGRWKDESKEFTKPANLKDFVWTYTSPMFVMVQENILQNFKLPEPVLCVGGVLAVELSGGVERQAIDGLYYYRARTSRGKIVVSGI